MATIPRLYGRGPYGANIYGVGFNTLHEVGGATQIAFSVSGIGNRITDVTGATQISFSVQGVLVKTWQDATSCHAPCEPGTWTQEYPPWTQRMAA